MCYPQDGVAALSFLDYGTEILNSDHLIASLDFGSITSSGKFLGCRYVRRFKFRLVSCACHETSQVIELNDTAMITLVLYLYRYTSIDPGTNSL